MIPVPSTPRPDAAAALTSLLASGPLPRLTWRGGGERLELSGRVSAIWANKVANLLVEEVDAGPGTRVLLDLPLHWRTLTWALGTWATGACVVVPSAEISANDDDDALAALAPDVLVTANAATAERAQAAGIELVVLVPLPSFALAVPGGTPTGVLDGAADVAAQPDDLGPVRAVDVHAAALEVGGAVRLHSDLLVGRGTGLMWWAASSVSALASGECLDLTD